MKSITFDDSRLLGVQITDNQETFVFINVYLPFQCEDNYENYFNYLGKLTAVVEETATSNIVVLGDCNAAKDTKFENELLLWCNSNNCIMSDNEILGDDLDTHTRMLAMLTVQLHGSITLYVVLICIVTCQVST